MAVNSLPVRLKGVSKIFIDPGNKSEVKAVDNVDIEIKAGELVTLLGPSGCGKTTTLRMIAGFELPTSGKVFIGEEDITYLLPNKRDTAMVFQSYGLFPHMTVAQNIAYGLKLRKIPRNEINERVNKILKMVGLENLGSRPPSRLSGGQQQRVALARSLVVEPSVLLLDEPLSNLDALLREQMRVEIRRIQRSLGITAVYVTHDRVEAMSLSDKIIVMNSGKIAQIGSPSEIYMDPISKFVAGFVGKVAFFPVDIVETKGEETTVKLDEHIMTISKGTDLVKGKEKCAIMARPESLKLVEPGEGQIDGTVVTNVYLGNSVESFIKTTYGEILVQIDNPALNKVYPENANVGVTIIPTIAKLLPDE